MRIKHILSRICGKKEYWCECGGKLSIPDVKNGEEGFVLCPKCGASWKVYNWEGGKI